MSFKLLYISSYHATLEYNHLTLFNEMGIDYFSTGIFKDPKNPLRAFYWQKDYIEKEVDKDLLEQFNKLNPGHKLYSKINLTKEFVDNFDVVLCSFSFPVQGILDDIWEVCKHKPFVYLTYAQQTAHFEEKLSRYRSQGLKLIRGSERESTLPNYAGHDAIIYCHIDEDVYSNWRGGENRVLTFANDFPDRIHHPNFKSYRAFEGIREYIPSDFYGVKSEQGGGKGFLNFEDKIEAYKSYDVYLALSSPPSTITYNFLEAWMTGCPVVTFGSGIGNGQGYNTWQAEEFIDNGINGFYSDDLNEVIQACLDLLEDEDLRLQFSEEGRAKCIELFGKERVKSQWNKFFKEIGFEV